MGVYIKNMEMPKSCGNCFFDTHCDNWRLRNWGAPPPDDCPLVPVQPHGKCIDADVLCKVLQKNSEDEWNNKTAPFSWAYAYDCVKDTVENMPTIIEAEEGER